MSVGSKAHLKISYIYMIFKQTNPFFDDLFSHKLHHCWIERFLSGRVFTSGSAGEMLGSCVCFAECKPACVWGSSHHRCRSSLWIYTPAVAAKRLSFQDTCGGTISETQSLLLLTGWQIFINQLEFSRFFIGSCIANIQFNSIKPVPFLKFQLDS